MDQSDSITINGIEIHQAVLGSGHPVLMVHGWGADLELLRPLARQLASYNYRILTCWICRDLEVASRRPSRFRFLLTPIFAEHFSITTK